MLSRFSHAWFFATLQTVDCQGPQSIRFSRQEYWSGLPFPSPGDLHDPGIEPMSLMSWSITLIIWDENKTRPYCPVMGWMVSPQNLYVAALTSNIIALRYRVFKEIEVKLDHKSRLLIWHSWYLYKKRKRHQRSLFFFELMDIEEAMWGHSEKTVIYKPVWRVSPKTKLDVP